MLKRSKERAICDFIAGMTDRFAINLYNSYKMNIFEKFLKEIKSLILKE